MESVVFEVPQFIPSVYKPSKSNLVLVFAYDAPKVWHELLDDILSTTSLLHIFFRRS